MSNSRESFLPKRRILVSLGVLGFGLAILAGAGGVVAAFLLLGVVREDKATICPSLEKIYSLTDIVGTTRTCFEDQHLKLRDLESEVDSYEMRFKEVVEEIPDPEIYALASPLKDHFTLFVEEGLAYQRGRVALEDNWRQAQLVNRRSKVLQTKLEAFQGQVLERYRGRLVQMDAYGQGFLCLFLTLSFLSLALGAVCLWVLRGGLKRADSKGDQLRVDLEASEGRDLAKTQFLSLISHGMRTPISGVLGMAELLGESHLNNVQKKYLENIVEAAEAQLPFLDNILDMSRSDAEKISLDAQPFSLRQLLGEVVSQLKGLAEKEGVSIRLLLSPLVPLSLRGDRPKVCRIVYNLLQKVIVFSDEGVIVVKVSSTLLDRSALTKVELTVAYRGGPRIEEDSAFAFESLVQRDDPASRHWSGVCLGLSICRDLCRWMGGNLEPEHDGVQQVFRAQLLLELESEGVPQVLALNGKKVLLSFEDDVLESYFREQLEHWGFVVELVNQGMLQELLVESDFSGVDLLFCCSEVISNLPPSLQLSCSVPLLLFGSEVKAMGAELPPVFKKASWVSGFALDERGMLEGLEGVLGEQACLAIADLEHFKVKDVRACFENCRWSPKLKVLMVEDDAMSRVVARELFTSLFIRIDLACNGTEALDLCARSSYDIVFMDLLMPECDGYETCRRIRVSEGLGEKIPIVALTASACGQERLKCTAVGMNELLTKPMSLESLSCCLQKWLPESLREREVTPLPNDGSKGHESVEASALPSESAFDWQYVLGLTAGREDTAQRVISVFVENLPRNIAAISAAISEENSETLRREAHTLKSSALYGGALALSEVARRLEKESQENGVSPLALFLEEEIHHCRDGFLAALDAAAVEGSSRS